MVGNFGAGLRKEVGPHAVPSVRAGTWHGHSVALGAIRNCRNMYVCVCVCVWEKERDWEKCIPLKSVRLQSSWKVWIMGCVCVWRKALWEILSSLPRKSTEFWERLRMTDWALEKKKNIRKSLVFTKRNWPVLAGWWKKPQEIFPPVGPSEWSASSSVEVVVWSKVGARRIRVPLFLEETVDSRIVTIQVFGLESVPCSSWGTMRDLVINPYSVQGL
jgi:hypothetical protein